MRKRTEVVLTLALAAAALVVVATVLRDTLVGSERSATEISEPEFVESWDNALRLATRVAGNESAPIKFLALVDLQCPASRAFHDILMEIVSETGGAVQVWYLHHPLSYHDHALSAARAAECASHYGSDAFRRWVEAVYAKQDALGRRSWSHYAIDAALPHPTFIEECATDPDRDGPIMAGLRFGDEIAIEGTPTLLVNGWRYFHVPSHEELREVVEESLPDVRTGRSR